MRMEPKKKNVTKFFIKINGNIKGRVDRNKNKGLIKEDLNTLRIALP